MAGASFVFFVIGTIFVNKISGYVINTIDIQNLDSVMRVIREEMEKDNGAMSEEDLKALKFSLIFPGTKWCGSGNVAENYDDLGSERETDMCCREHDNCPDVIGAGEVRHNLTNDAFYSRLSCTCDETFSKCLRKVNSYTAKTIGTVYFNIINTKCYREDYPTVSCNKKGGWLNRKCLEHKYNTTAEKIYQWFDVINF